MAESPDSMRLFENRLATFSKTDHPAKKHQSSQGRGTPREWPHETPTAHELAAAGFYFNPLAKSADNVSCFTCKVNLGGWEIDDEPIKEHLAHSGTCAWAVCRSVISKAEDRDPCSEKLAEARIATFATWPHEHKKKWKGKAKKMADAGWVMDPNSEADDGATCFYCELSLDGWKAHEDPHHEHKRRALDCPFFKLCEQYAASRPKKARSRTSTASRASRLSTQSVVSTFSEAPSLMSLGEPATELEGDTSVATVTSTTSTTKGRKRAATGKGRGKKQAVRELSPEDTEVTTTLTHLDDSVLPSQLGMQETSLEFTNAAEDQSEMPTESGPINKLTRGRVKGGKKATAKQEAAAIATEESQVHNAEAASILIAEPPKASTRAKRGKKRTSDGLEKPQALNEQADAESVPEPPVKPKAARATRGKKTKASAELQSQVELPAEAMEVDQMEAGKTVEPVKPKKGRKPKAAKPVKAPTPEVEPESDPDMESQAEVLGDEEAAPVMEDAELDEAEENWEVHHESSGNIEVLDHTATIDEEHEPSPTPHKARQSQARTSTVKQLESATSTPRSDRSTHSSDAENHPPSSAAMTFGKQSKAAATKEAPVELLASFPAPPLSPTKMTRVPLAAQTPNRSPQRSPHKLGLLRSNVPWTATDIEMVFATGVEISEGQENAHSDINRELAEIGGKLTSPEKVMTVEQWVRHQAEKGETKLKAECERLVSLFEREGQRAMSVLSGVQVN